MREKSTAILLFSQDAKDEFGHKSFGLNYQRFNRVHAALVNKVKQTISSTGLPMFEADSSVQRGEDFASRLIHAIHWVKEKGFSKVIIVGNDSPGLSRRQLLDSENALANGKSVLGKDIHGGTYLIGLDTELFQVSDLKQINWHTSRVFEQLRQCLSEVYVLAETHADLNSIRDLKARSSVDYVKRFLKLIWRIILYNQLNTRLSQSLVPIQFKRPCPHRGPPLTA